MQKYIVWDYNGTILDDASLCVEINNQILTKRNLPTVKLEQHVKLFDFPIYDFYKKIGFDYEKYSFNEIVEEYLDLYVPASFNAPMRIGVSESLEIFKQNGYKQIILSATRLDILIEQVEKLEIMPYFETLLGLSDSFAAGKDDIAKKWMSHNNISGESMTIIGDTTHDFFVSQQVSCDCFLLTGGHNSIGRLQATGAKVFTNVNDVVKNLINI